MTDFHAHRGTSGIVSIWLTMAALVLAGGIWLGTIQSELNFNSKWIADQIVYGMSTRVAVMDIQVIQINEHLVSTDHRVENLETMFRNGQVKAH